MAMESMAPKWNCQLRRELAARCPATRSHTVPALAAAVSLSVRQSMAGKSAAKAISTGLWTGGGGSGGSCCRKCHLIPYRRDSKSVDAARQQQQKNKTQIEEARDREAGKNELGSIFGCVDFHFHFPFDCVFFFVFDSISFA